MRIPLSRIWRAFPELDRFTDEQCARFVRAACRGTRTRLVRWSLLAFCCASLFATTLATATYTHHAMWRHPRVVLSPSPVWHVLWGLLFIAAVALPPLATLLLRDVLLRRAIHATLRTRGICHQCGYSLVGLPVSGEHIVVCPECARESEVDPSLSELVHDDRGRERFAPATFDDLPRFWTPRRREFAKRAVLLLAVLLLVVFPASLGGYEWFLRRQAGVAERDLPTVAAFLALHESHLPNAAPGAGASALGSFWDAVSSKAAAERRRWPDTPATSSLGEPLFPDFTQVYMRDYLAAIDELEAAHFAEQEALARSLLVDYGIAGVYESLRDAASNLNSMNTDLDFTSPTTSWVLERHLIEMAQVCAARAHVALEMGDSAEFAEAFEAMLALARIAGHYPSLSGVMMTSAIDSLAYRAARVCLADGPSREWLDAIDGAMTRQGTRTTPAYNLEAERLDRLEVLATTFSEPSNVRFGKRSSYVQTVTGGTTHGRLGTYAANRTALHAIFDKAASRILQDPHARPAGGLQTQATWELVLIRRVPGEIDAAMLALDLAEVDRRGLSVLIALERYRLRHKEYPAHLEALVPEFMPAIPADPWAASPLRYIRTDPMREISRRHYLLYSVGPDGVDNHAQVHTRSPDRFKRLTPASIARFKGFDIVINENW